MKNMAVNQKLILLMLMTSLLMCWAQGVSHGLGGGGGGGGAVVTAVRVTAGAVGTAVVVAAGAVLIAGGAVDLGVALIDTVVWHTDSLSSLAIIPNAGTIGVVASNLIHLGDLHTIAPHTTLTYDSPINSIAFSPNNPLLASASTDSTIQLWNLNTNTLQATLHGHTSDVLDVAFSPDGSLLASGSADGIVGLWNPVTETLQATVQGHTDSVLSVAFSPDGSLLASGSADGTVRLWNLHRQTLQATLETHMDSVLSVAFSSDGSLLASASADGLVGLWNPHTQTLQATLGHESPVLSVTFSPYGNLLATGSADGVARLWDPHVPEHKATLGHESPVESVTFDGSTLITGSQDGSVRQWEITSSTTATELTAREQNMHIYWTDTETDKIQRANLDGSNVQDLVTHGYGLRSPRGIALDVAGGKMYWTDWYTDKIQRANLDGSSVQDLITRTQGLETPRGIALDLAGGKMYWTDTETHKIQRANLDGSNLQDLVTHGYGLRSPVGIAIFSQVQALSSTLREDVNRDGVVDFRDIVYVAQHYGQTKPSDADVNKDGVINIDDIVLVAAVVDSAPAAPAVQSQIPKNLTAATVDQWLTEAKLTGNNTPTYQRGILTLEQLLAALTPKETILLPNYPNPFNPETWIPYRLAEDAFVTLAIYDGAGQVVRTLDIGHQTAAFYESRSKAIYWDGRNEIGEQVVSGVYFYHLSAGGYSDTRKMLILK